MQAPHLTRRAWTFCPAASLLLALAGGQTTTLTFDIQGASNGSAMPQDYGDRVVATTMGNYSYGSSGPTPNVKVDYAANGGPDLIFWTTGYNDLVNVVENEIDGDTGYQVFLSADAGFEVSLAGFDVGNWGGAINVPAITVRDQTGAVLFQDTDVPLAASSTPSHVTYAFAPVLTAQVVVIDIDTSGLAGNSDNVGLDNIAFSQSASTTVGTSYCGPAVPNSLGYPGTIMALGSDVASANDLTLVATCLPVDQFGYFLVGRTQGFACPAASLGCICLSGDIGRYNAVSEIGMSPVITLQVDLTDLPLNNPPFTTSPGDTLNFQCWYRDSGNTNNFTDGVSIVFQ